MDYGPRMAKNPTINLTVALTLRKVEGSPQSPHDIATALSLHFTGTTLFVEDGSHRPSGTYRLHVTRVSGAAATQTAPRPVPSAYQPRALDGLMGS